MGKYFHHVFYSRSCHSGELAREAWIAPPSDEVTVLRSLVFQQSLQDLVKALRPALTFHDHLVASHGHGAGEHSPLAHLELVAGRGVADLPALGAGIEILVHATNSLHSVQEDVVAVSLQKLLNHTEVFTRLKHEDQAVVAAPRGVGAVTELIQVPDELFYTLLLRFRFPASTLRSLMIELLSLAVVGEAHLLEQILPISDCVWHHQSFILGVLLLRKAWDMDGHLPDYQPPLHRNSVDADCGEEIPPGGKLVLHVGAIGGHGISSGHDGTDEPWVIFRHRL